MTATSAKVWIAVPNTGKIRLETCQSITAMIAASRLARAVEVRYLTCAPLVLARHALVKEFLSDRDRTHLLFVDSDMGLPADTVDRLLRLDTAIACLPCPILAPSPQGTSNTGPSITTNIWQLASPAGMPAERHLVRRLDPDDFPPKPFRCYGTGLACCLIQREVLEAMRPPLFSLTFREDHSELLVGEDAAFFNLARNAGYEIVVDPSAICDHFKEIDLTHFEHFFLDEPVSWCNPSTLPSNAGAMPQAYSAVIAGSGEVHAQVASFLEDQRQCFQREGDCFSAADYGSSLKEAVRHFLGRRTESYLLLLDDRTVPPRTFVERFASLGVPAATGLFREKVGKLPLWGLWCPGANGVPDRVESVHERDEPWTIAYASLRATILSRELLEKIGTTWIDNGCTAVDAGKRLSETLSERLRIPMTAIPVGCAHWDVLGLRQLLETKVRLKSRLKQR
ncbi:MAG: hypothetical protein U1D30_02720 [Planctomycetota bacterium]